MSEANREPSIEEMVRQLIEKHEREAPSEQDEVEVLRKKFGNSIDRIGYGHISDSILKLISMQMAQAKKKSEQ